MKICAFVFARGGSKGLPGKNIRPLAGKPLIAWSIEIAKELSQVKHVFVSTDEGKIADVAREFGAAIINRPKELATDNAPEWLAWQHAVKWVQDEYAPFDIFLSLPATAPLRSKYDVERCVWALDNDTDIVMTMAESERNPWFNMVTRNSDGFIHTVIPNDGTITRRQDAPVTYDLTTVAYATRPDFVLTASNPWDGRVRGVIISKRNALDIDTINDFMLAEYLIRKGDNNGS